MRPGLHRSRIAFSAVAISLTIPLGAAVAGGQRTVDIEGGGSFDANKAVTLDFHFDRDRVSVRSGDTIRWENEGELRDFHTVTIVDVDDLPGDLDAVLSCGEPGTVCGDLFNHGDETNPIPVHNEGAPGLDARGDSLLVPPDGGNESVVSAPSGSTLHYMCLIHGWMQATIRVR